MIRPHKREAYIFSRVIHAAQDVEEVEINCNKVADRAGNEPSRAEL